MAQPRLQIDSRVDRVEEALLLVAQQSSEINAEEIEHILHGPQPKDKREVQDASS